MGGACFSFEATTSVVHKHASNFGGEFSESINDNLAVC